MPAEALFAAQTRPAARGTKEKESGNARDPPKLPVMRSTSKSVARGSDVGSPSDSPETKSMSPSSPVSLPSVSTHTRAGKRQAGFYMMLARGKSKRHAAWSQEFTPCSLQAGPPPPRAKRAFTPPSRLCCRGTCPARASLSTRATLASFSLASLAHFSPQYDLIAHTHTHMDGSRQKTGIERERALGWEARRAKISDNEGAVLIERAEKGHDGAGHKIRHLARPLGAQLECHPSTLRARRQATTPR